MTELPILNCDDCGACCTHVAAPPGFAMFLGPFSQREMEYSVDWEIFKTLPGAIKRELSAHYAQDRPVTNGPCLWYDATARKCLHYEHRPTICRNFEIGGESCRFHRKRVGIVIPDSQTR